ncbi:MAG: hypothetical protein Q8J62_10340 [Candidatus Cloacimonadaceae bacterium]|nr:hypothetical protein [Candidatus Cloacimonadaceae bacterium]
MDNDLSFSDWLEHIKDKLFCNQWIILHKRVHSQECLEKLSIYSGLIKKENVNEALKSSNWDRTPYDGVYGIIESHENGKKSISYMTYHDDIVEPLVYIRDFHSYRPSEKCILEEVVLFFDLFEKTERGERHYIFVDENGNEISAIVIDINEIRIQRKFLLEYMYIKQMEFVLYFEIWRNSEFDLKRLGLEEKAQQVKTENARFDIYIDEANQYVQKGKSQGQILGKYVYKLPRGYKSWHWDADSSHKAYEKFIIDEDNLSIPIEYSSNPSYLSNYFGKNKGNPHYLTPVYFKLDVMQKYYNNPSKYQVHDSMIEMISRWSLRIDNNHPEAIIVFLGDLGGLPIQEQKYWRSFNIQPLNGISRVAFRRGFLAEFTDPEAIDLVFRRDINMFYDTWYSYHNWYLFKPLSKEDAYRLESLHIPHNNSEIDFKNQVEAICVLLIESINVKILRSIVGDSEENEKSISVLNRYLSKEGYNASDLIEFLRNLNTLRNLKLHRQKAESNTKLQSDQKRTSEYFKIDKTTSSDIISFILKKGSKLLYQLLNHIENQAVESDV